MKTVTYGKMLKSALTMFNYFKKTQNLKSRKNHVEIHVFFIVIYFSFFKLVLPKLII